MTKAKPILMLPAIASALTVLLPAMPAAAQDAAETAIILSGTSRDTGRVSRDMGNVVRGSIGGAADAISATRQGRVQRAPNRTPGAVVIGPRPTPGGLRVTTGDALERTDAPECQLGNGSSVRVSGTFVPSAETLCPSASEVTEGQ